MIRKLFAFGLAVVLALMPVQAFGKTVSVTNVSYDPTREMFEQYNKIFEDHWKEKTGDDVEVIQSHGGSGKHPDGGVGLNTTLAENRQDNTAKIINRDLKKAKIDAAVDTKYTAQDWEGFQELVSKSNIQDKELILRVLSMYQDPEQREQEIGRAHV